MTLPNFIVIGASRSGTTSIHRWLSDHPDVFVPREKSPNYFAAPEPVPSWEPPQARVMARQWVRDLETYESLFDGAASRPAIGDVSPVYLQATGIAARIRERCPDVKLIALLRDPAERAFAHFLGRRRDGIEPVSSFAARIERELAEPLPDEVAFGHYLGCGRYHHFLQPYLADFDRSQLRLYLYDDLVDDPVALMTDLLEFVGADPTVRPATEVRLNRSGEIRNPWKRAVWTRSVGIRTRLRPILPARLRRAGGAAFLTDIDKPELDPSTRARMVDVLRDDVLALARLLDRDLSGWLR
jgi:hypothetical protein